MKIKVKIALTPQMAAYLAQLVKTGLYGDSEKECARRLLEGSLQQLLQEELLERKDNP